MTPGNKLEILALLSLERCLLRISRISTGSWRVAGVKVGPGSAAGELAGYAGTEAAAVYMVMDSLPMTAVMAASPADIECLSKGYTGHGFPRGARVTPAEEIMLTELGNILLNALINGLLNELKITLLPALPRFAAGDAASLTAALGPAPEAARVIAAKLALDCGGSSAEWDLFVLLPEDLARRLD
ncbi:MAG TPA: hypothetical protein DEQ38_04585 [Elusimicrobia bacterium]|nr:MAG: hypothetical protein A2089_00550 [Elusimicrobia bacterium GWD2_63_28]HCC47378.1 hypothetical protein [Elusimicrobiota bacterium]